LDPMAWRWRTTVLRTAAGGDGHSRNGEFCYFVIDAVAWTLADLDGCSTGRCGMGQSVPGCRPCICEVGGVSGPSADSANVRFMTSAAMAERWSARLHELAAEEEVPGAAMTAFT
jgi:hypothetical protein